MKNLMRLFDYLNIAKHIKAVCNHEKEVAGIDPVISQQRGAFTNRHNTTIGSNKTQYYIIQGSMVTMALPQRNWNPALSYLFSKES